MKLIHPVWGELTGLSDREEDQILCDIRDRIMGLGEYERYQHHGPVRSKEHPMSWEFNGITRLLTGGRP